jgi:tetratricopeptide (TPR) repeat protein
MISENDPESARLLAGEAHEIGLRRSWEDVMARALHSRARAALESGSPGEGRDWCDKAMALASKANQRSTVAASLVTMGRIESLAGNTAAAVKSVERALAIDRQLADPYAIAMDYARLAEIQNRSGDVKAAGISRTKADRILRLLGTGWKTREEGGLTVE